MNFVFDVDGTLTPSREKINQDFESWFTAFCEKNNVYLCSGSDYAKTLEQLGKTICETSKAVYSCSGNAKYVNGLLQYSNDFELRLDEKEFILNYLEKSPFKMRTGNHLEHRLGLYNFSVVGRGANKEQRKLYFDYDSQNKERLTMANQINNVFKRLEATVAGETGIDIYLRGKDKSQISEEVKPFTFFGDSIYVGGNDYSLAMKSDKYYHVSDWEETWKILKEIDDDMG